MTRAEPSAGVPGLLDPHVVLQRHVEDLATRVRGLLAELDA